MIRRAPRTCLNHCLLLAGGVLLAGCAGSAQSQKGAATEVSAAPVGAERTENGLVGRAVMPDDALAEFQLQGDSAHIARTQVTASSSALSSATRFEMKQAGADPWSFQIAAKNAAPVAAGDALLASFWIRCERSFQESGEGVTEFVFELGSEPWTKSVSHPVRVGQEWQEIHVPFKAVANYVAGEAQFIFRLGYEPQILDIAQVRVHNFGAIDIGQLPRTEISYRGREPDSTWRAEAESNIKKHRTGALSVEVVDAHGKPVVGAEVHATLEKNEFWFGSAVVARKLAFEEGNEKYRERLLANFNGAVLENNLKWKPLAGDWGTQWSVEHAKLALDWLKEAGLRTRGHVLVWPSFKHLPNELAALKSQPEELRKRVREHVRELAREMKGKVDHWDVINEPYDNHDLMDLLGPEEMVEWFRIAREEDPSAKLYLNDYAILSGGAGETGHRAHFEKTASFLIEKGAPIDGLGMQGHFAGALTAPEDLTLLLDRYAKLGLPLIVTEFDINLDDPELAGDYTRDFYTTLYAHPAVEGIMTWGFWDGAHWKKQAPLFKMDWSLKESGKAFRSLVHDKWRTDVKAKSDASGRVELQGTLGTYQVVVAKDGKTTTKSTTLSRKGGALRIELP